MVSEVTLQRVLVSIAFLLLVCSSLGCSQLHPARTVVVISADVMQDGVASPAQPRAADPAPSSPTHAAAEGSDTEIGIAYREALFVAGQWDQEARFYGIMPSTIMGQLLALPYDAEEERWVFRFAVDGREYELLVEIAQGVLQGSNEFAIPAHVAPLVESLLPLESIGDSIDDRAARQVVRDSGATECQPSSVVGFWHPREQENPVWVIYCASTEGLPYVAVDAVTAEIVSLPGFSSPSSPTHAPS